MSAVILTQAGLPIFVDRADYAWLSQYAWRVERVGRKFYAIADIHEETVSMHRLILGLAKGDKLVADHRNGCTVDNRRKNLRIASHALNAHNAVVKRNSRTGIRGVTQHKNGLFQARIRIDGRRTSLGYFNTAEEAGEAYAAASAKHQARMEQQYG